MGKHGYLTHYKNYKPSKQWKSYYEQLKIRRRRIWGKQADIYFAYQEISTYCQIKIKRYQNTRVTKLATKIIQNYILLNTSNAISTLQTSKNKEFKESRALKSKGLIL